MKRSAAVAALVVGSAFTTLLAADTVRILAPVHAQQVPGAFGSIWSTELRVFNSGDSTATLYPPCITGGPCPINEVPAGGDVEVVWLLGPDKGGPKFFDVDSSELAQLTFQLRVFDESRTMLNWGTIVPVVEWEKARGERFWFVRVPASPPFRHTLRIYSATSPHPPTARVRYYNADTSELVAERTLLVGMWYKELHSSSILELEDVSSVRIEVVSETGDDIWAMVSVTNDDTQVVTILPGEHRTGD
ncbi:MAG: hypothetical protein KY432_11680 [Acidobacteria bacterium]|nr:hypothetical protein [Acidobacteriota bacterium]